MSNIKQCATLGICRWHDIFSVDFWSKCCFCLIFCLLVFQLCATAYLVSSWNSTNVFFSFFKPSSFKIPCMIHWFVKEGIQRNPLWRNCTLLLETQSSRPSLQQNSPGFMATLHTLTVLLYLLEVVCKSLCVWKWKNFFKASKLTSKENRRRESSWAKDWKASSGRPPSYL